MPQPQARTLLAAGVVFFLSMIAAAGWLIWEGAR